MGWRFGRVIEILILFFLRVNFQLGRKDAPDGYEFMRSVEKEHLPLLNQTQTPSVSPRTTTFHPGKVPCPSGVLSASPTPVLGAMQPLSPTSTSPGLGQESSLL